MSDRTPGQAVYEADMPSAQWHRTGARTRERYERLAEAAIEASGLPAQLDAAAAEIERLRSGLTELATRQNQEAASLRTDALLAYRRRNNAEGDKYRDIAAVRSGLAKTLRRLLAGPQVPGAPAGRPAPRSRPAG